MKKIIALIIAIMMMTLVACTPKTSVTETVYKDAETKTEAAKETETAKDNEAEESKGNGDGNGGGNKEEKVSPYPITLTDKFGQEVVIEEEPMTMISLSPEITEIIFALNSGDKLAGRSSYCNFPEEALAINDFGTLFDVNVESLVEASPDVVFLSSMAGEEQAQMIKDQGLTVVTLDKDGSLDGTYEYIELLGKVLNKVNRSVKVTDSIKADIADVQAKVEGLEKPSVYYVVYAAEGVASTATGDTFGHGIITAAGGDNIAKDATSWQYNVEQLVEKDPMIVICAQNAVESIATVPGYSDLTAVNEGGLYGVNPDIFSRQGPRIGEAVRVMAEIFHPETFK